MPADILAFPALATVAARRFAVAIPRREYTFAEVVRLLALNDADTLPRTQIDYLRDYARQCAMPLPKNARRRHGHLVDGVPEMIGQRSRWCALQFDAWLDRRGLPPGAPDGAAPPLPVAARADLAARAAQLAGRSR